MTNYILKRLLLILPTGIGVITVFFFISEFVPGGPLDQVERMIMDQANKADPSAMAKMGGGGGGELKIDPRERMLIKRKLGLNYSLGERYMRSLLWCSADSIVSSVEIDPGQSRKVVFRDEERLIYRGQDDDYHLYLPEVMLSNGKPTAVSFDKKQECYVSLLDSTVKFDPVTGKQIDGPDQMTSIPVVGKSQTFTETVFLGNGEKEKTQETRTEIYVDESTSQVMGNWKNWHGMFLMKFPMSISKNKKCWELIVDRLHISARLGITAFLVTYSICITLGIAKAVRNDSKFDSLSSMVILIGYGIPGFVLAVFLIKGFGPGSDAMVHWIPLRGIHSPDNIYEKMTTWQRFWDSAHHMVAPVLCLTIGSFAQLTLLTKNSVLDQFNQLYATAARARGLSHRSVLIRHVLRNAMIPLVTGFPAAFVFMFFAGSVLIEKIFSIDGLGLLSYTALVERDYPLIISNMFIFTFMGLMCKLLSDLMYVVVDPRISFEGSKA
jgi:microcin C transport system permease protein